MVQVNPFLGIRYNPDIVGRIEDVITPPYDVINPAQQQAFYERDPHNIIRLELGKTRPTDDENNNRYTRAAEYFSRWQEETILISEARPSIYLYEQAFPLEGRDFTRSGVICTLRLEEYDRKAVLPHEETLPNPKADRLFLMRACRANFSSIFGLFIDEERQDQKLYDTIRKSAPSFSVEDDGVTHRLWVIQDAEIINRWKALLADKKIYIADGHHRYETALQFAKEMHMRGCAGCGNVMMTLVNVYDPGLVVLPTHRMVKKTTTTTVPRFLEDLKKKYRVTEQPMPDFQDNAAFTRMLRAALQEGRRGNHRFAAYAGGNTLYLISVPRTKEKLDPKRSAAWNNLDITVLEEGVIKDLLGIGPEERAEGTYLSYTRDETEAVQKVREGEIELALFVNPTETRDVVRVAAEGDKMPQKSTFFYPKLVSGLVINKLD